MYNLMFFVLFVDNEISVIVIIDKDIKIWMVEDGKVKYKIDIGKIFIDEEYGIIGVLGCYVVFSFYGFRSFLVFNCKMGERVCEVNVFSGVGVCFVGEIKVIFKE